MHDKRIYLAIGGLLLLAIAAARSTSPETISITRQMREELIRARQEITGRPLTEGERQASVSSYISDEILLREAYARDLHHRDSLARQRLLDVMRSLLAEEPPEPSDTDLHAYLTAHADIYRVPATITLSHVYFATEDAVTPLGSERLLAMLRAGDDPSGLGEHFWLGSRLERYPESQLAQLFGNQFATSVINLPPGEWSGPIASTRGVHFVRADDRHPPHMPAFDMLAPALRRDWIASMREEALQRKVDGLRRKYRIEIEPGGER